MNQKTQRKTSNDLQKARRTVAQDDSQNSKKVKLLGSKIQRNESLLKTFAECSMSMMPNVFLRIITKVVLSPLKDTYMSACGQI